VTASTRLALLAVLAAAPGAPRAHDAVNPMHPLFAPLDARGKPAGRPEDVSADATCGSCHDAKYIAAHSTHGAAHAKATCIECHVEGGRLAFRASELEAGKLRREAVRIGKPTAGNCAACHGLVADAASPVLLPPGFEAGAATAADAWSLTQGEGAVVSPQPMSASFLDLEGKAALAAPWDAHAARLVDCVACHYARNDPGRGSGKRAALSYVADDPRRLGTAEFLHRPDHRLASTDCRSCHAPLEVHGFLPYRERHMEVLACASCHVPGPRGPAVEMVDATVVTADGIPVVHYRNVERRPGEPLNVATVRPLRPLFVLRAEPDGARRLGPVNVVSRWRWVSGPEGAEVPLEVVRRAYLDGSRYAPAIVAAFDADRDGRIQASELRLDTPAKVELVASRLRAAGVAEPAVSGSIDARPLAHGIAGRALALRDCGECHAPGARLSGDYPIAPYLPAGVAPRPSDRGGVELAGSLVPDGRGGLAFRREPGGEPGGLHVLGHSRKAQSNAVGFAIFALVLTGISIHGLARLALRRRSAAAAPPDQGARTYVFGRYERIWHWTMALSGVGLILTGLEVHAPGRSWPFALPTAVALHNALAMILIVNASLALFYHLATAAIRNFIPRPQGLLSRALEHLEYQSRGIFRGGPHPRLGGEKLNPLQQLTYLALLNLLFPLQIATGLLIWAIGHWPSVGTALGGLAVVAPLHNLGAWMFLTFFVLHVYLVTTGRTPSEHLRSMITGYRDAEPAEAKPQGGYTP
jgi:thiosulfate reductase cytochrome b subunit/mono/diheme cytochrome c family protein